MNKNHQLWRQTKRLLSPYQGILSFLCLLFFFWFLWEGLVDGQIAFLHFPWEIPTEAERDSALYFLGRDITPEWLKTSCLWLTDAAAWFIRLFPNQQDLMIGNGVNLLYPSNLPWYISIVIGCTGVKQMTVFACIMLCYKIWQPAKYQWNKLWYIPVGCLLLTAYNIIRIGGTVILTKGAPERFDSLHDGIFRYIYYTIVFLLWVIWEELYAKRSTN
ncbi:MAG: exosortase/archaeosortase family protein [Candidatus Symbiothrix sp.]|jgi:exosortase/archaeosortase family protein|nr:exosortase/archaeosortase family protein [Candidatus Symbiothrix sp.]